MADEVQKYLISKLKDVIIESENPNNIPSKVVVLGPTPKLDQLRTKLNIPPDDDLLLNNLNIVDREKLYSLNNLLTEWHSYSQKHSLYAPYYAFRLNRIIDGLEQQQQALSNGENQTRSSNEEKGAAAYGWSTRSVNGDRVLGLKDKVISLRRLIVPDQLPGEKKDEEFRVFGLVGMRGIGKTTLAQMLFNLEEMRDHFLPRVWVCVSRQPWDDKDPKKETVKRILRCLGVEDDTIDFADEKKDLDGLLYLLRQELLGKRYFIVLDDVWNTEYLEFVSCLAGNELGECDRKRLAYGLPKEYGGAVVVTSRSKEIAGNMVGEENLHRISPLSDEDCWKIFKTTYEEERGELVVEDSKTLEKKVQDKCCGLPLAAKMMGEIARNPQLSALNQASNRRG